MLAEWSDSLSFCTAPNRNVYLTCLDNTAAYSLTLSFFSSCCSRWRTHYRAYSKPPCATATSGCVSSMHLCSSAPHCPFDGRWRSPGGWSSWYWPRFNFKWFLLNHGLHLLGAITKVEKSCINLVFTLSSCFLQVLCAVCCYEFICLLKS